MYGKLLNFLKKYMILVLGVVAQETNIQKYFQIEIINERKLMKILSLKKYCYWMKLYMHKTKRRKQSI
jgi:hypothetical protein